MTDTRSVAPDLVALREALADEAGRLERELAEIDMLVSQARQEAGRHEQKRSQAAERLAAMGDGTAVRDVTAASSQLMNLTRRAAVMESQVDVLEGKRKAIARYHDSLIAHAEALGSAGAADRASDETLSGDLPPAVSRTVLAAQEDLRREIAKAMHDGPAQSLTNIVLQAQIVERIVAQNPAEARHEVRQLVGMVQQTLDATKSFIFDVRPMVLDDLGLVPTLRRATRERGRRAGVAIDFESVGTDRRLPVEVESTLFRVFDEALGAYLSAAPDSLSLRLDWSDRVEGTVAARRAGADLAGIAEDELPEGADLPPALASMLEDRRADRAALVEVARSAAIAALPDAAWRAIQLRAATIGAEVTLLDGGGTLRLTTEPIETDRTEPAPAANVGAGRTEAAAGESSRGSS